MTQVDTITKKNVRKLIRALESGKYRKTEGYLCNKKGDAFCCLGVQADIHGAVWKTNKNGRLFPEGNAKNASTLEPKWAGGLSLSTQNELARLNDNSITFKSVIKYLKEELLPKAL